MKALITALAVAFAAATIAAQDDPDAAKKAEKEAEAKAKARIDEFRAKYAKCKSDDERVTVIDGLGDDQHTLIFNELKGMIGKGGIDIRAAVAQELGKFRKNEKVAKVLLAAARSEKEPEVGAKYLAAVGRIGCRSVAADLAGFYNAKLALSREAVVSSGKLRSKTAIDPLISFLIDLEREKDELARSGGDGGGGQVPGGGPAPGPSPAPTPGGSQQSDDDDKKKRVTEVLPKAVQALRDITGEKHQVSKDWATWWKKHKATFKEYAEE
jgi:hypothetical protein